MSALRSTAVLAAAFLLASGVRAQSPSNDLCLSGTIVHAGINPASPNGSSGVTFTNVNATNSLAGLAGCAAFNRDVWFAYVPDITGYVTVSTCTPPGFAAGTLSDTNLAVYTFGVCSGAGQLLACNDDSSACGANSLKSSVTFPAYEGFFYFIRVGSFSVNGAGTFYLTITEPAPSGIGSCSGAVTLSAGTNGPIAMNGVNVAAADALCGYTNSCHVWMKYTTPSFPGLRELDFKILDGDEFNSVAVLEGASCGSATLIGCGTKEFQIQVLPNTNYYFRLTMFQLSQPLDIDFSVELGLQEIPTNDECATAYPVTDGSHPLPGEEAAFTNVGASDSTGYFACGTSPERNDVFFDYLATTSGKVSVSTAAVAGVPAGSLVDTVLFVHSACGGSLIVCNDDSFGFRSAVEFDAVQGQHYLIRVASYGTAETEGTFPLTIKPKFELQLSSPLGAGSFRLRVQNGAPFHVVYNCLTLNAGVYPSGPFFGIEPTLTEISLQLAYAEAPFLVLLDAAGVYQFDIAGLPPLAVYGVSLAFDFAGQIAGVTPPATVQIN